jgi:hypothetical protein
VNRGAYLVTVDGLSTGTVTLGEITTLSPGNQLVPGHTMGSLHEVLDNSVESRSLVSVSKILTLGSLSSAQSPKVLYSLGDSPTLSAMPHETRRLSSLPVESHDDPAHGFTSMFDIEVNLHCQIGNGNKGGQHTLLVMIGPFDASAC